jgi:signal transduction histidine kinase
MFNEPAMVAAALTYLEESACLLALRLDAEHRVVDANAHATLKLGGEIKGRPFADLLVDFARPQDLQSMLQDQENQHALNVTLPGQLPETLFFRFLPLPDGTLALGSVNTAEQDQLRHQMLQLNRELNDMTRQLHLANAELKALDELKNRFLGMAAHDLRRPIGVVMTYADFILDEEGDRLSPEGRGFLETCLKAATTMSSLVDNFLHVSVVESGQLRLRPRPTSMEEILTGVLPLVQVAATRKHIEMDLAMPTSDISLMVDGDKIQQVLINLLINAIEYSQPRDRVEVSSRFVADRVVFQVRDHGPGIAPDDQDKIFEKFSSAGVRKTAGERSTGLGLAIAKQAVEAHGGRIWVDSTPPDGSTFSFEIPVACKAPATEQEIGED